MTLTLTTEYGRDVDTTSPWLFGLSGDIPLGGRVLRAAQLTAAQAPAVEARYDLAAAVWGVRAAVRRAVIDRQYAVLILSQAQALSSVRMQQSQLVAARIAQGEDSASASRQIAADLLTAQSAVEQDQARLAAANAELQDALDARIDDSRPPAIADIGAPNSNGAAIPYEDLRRQAGLSRPEILDALVAYDEAEANLRVEIAKQYPTVSISPGYTWDRGLSKLPFDLALVLPPPGRNRAGVDAAEATRAAAGAALDAAQAKVLSHADDAYGAWTTASRLTYGLNTQSLQLARQKAEATQRSAAAGEASRLDALAAQAELIQALLDAGEAQHQAWLAKTDLEDALQTAFDPAEEAVVTDKIKALVSK